MSLLKKLFGGKGAESSASKPVAGKLFSSGLTDANHPARKLIDEAALVADQTVHLSVHGDTELMQTNSVDGMRVVALIDKALEIAPGDLDLLTAKSGALCCAMQFKTAEEVIDQVLSIDPQHFEARQRKDHWAEWAHLFHYPPWSAAATALHPIMGWHLQRQRGVQLVRDGLQTGVAVLRPAQREQFPGGLSNAMPSKWVPMWSDTPHGAIVANYVVVSDNPADPWKGEGFLPIGVPDQMTPAAGYWLLQRMCHLSSCFLVLTDGRNVLYNSRYVFSDTIRSTLSTIVDKMIRRSARIDPIAFQQACQWHMNNFDLRLVR